MKKNTKLQQLRNTKGITLIALVITIVVLLILAAVSIAMLTGQNGILTKAQSAKDKTNSEADLEKVKVAVMGSYGTDGKINATDLNKELNAIEGKTAASTDGYPGKNATVTINGVTYSIDKDGNVATGGTTPAVSRTGLKVGDYIDYKPDTANAYSKDNLTSAKSGSSSNTADITQDSLNWQILKINDDGSMDLIGSPTSQDIYFSGAAGYNNGVNIMNDICKSLYSHGSITARSINITDIENQMTTAGKNARDTYNNGAATYGTTKQYTGGYSYYPNLYANEIGAGINSTTTLTGGLTVSDSGSALDTTTPGYKQASTSGLTVTQTYYYISTIDSANFGEGEKVLNNSTWFWVASRFVRCNSDYADFGLRFASTFIGR